MRYIPDDSEVNVYQTIVVKRALERSLQVQWRGPVDRNINSVVIRNLLIARAQLRAGFPLT